MNFYVSPPQNAAFFILGEGIAVFFKFLRNFLKNTPQNSFICLYGEGVFLK